MFKGVDERCVVMTMHLISYVVMGWSVEFGFLPMPVARLRTRADLLRALLI